MEKDKTKIIELASSLLKISLEEAEEFCVPLDEIDAYYFSVPVKGGGSIIIDFSLEVLYADSTVSYDEHINAYKNGIRTPLEAFEM